MKLIWEIRYIILRTIFLFSSNVMTFQLWYKKYGNKK